MSRFSALASLPENSVAPPPAPKLRPIPKSILSIFSPSASSTLFHFNSEVRKLALPLVCKFYGLSFEQYETECLHHGAEVVSSYTVVNVDDVEELSYEFEFLSISETTSKNALLAKTVRNVFKECTQPSCESDADRHQREFVEFKSILSKFWADTQLTENDDGEFNISAYTTALCSLVNNSNLFPDLPFHFKANAFIDVISPRVYCAETQVFFIPHIGSTEYADSCERIHNGFTDVLIVTQDSDIIANDFFAESIGDFFVEA